MLLATVVTPALSGKLKGVGEYESGEEIGHIISSVKGGRAFKIHGEGFDPDKSAAEHTIWFRSTSIEQGPPLTNDQDFLSNIIGGTMYYETPQINDILSPESKGFISNVSPVLHVTDSQGNSFACNSDEQ